MYLRKFLSALLTVALVFVVAACVGGEPGAADGEAPAVASVAQGTDGASPAAGPRGDP